MLFSRPIRVSLLFAFALFAAGGPALHYAPFLGFHGAPHDGLASCESEQIGLARFTGCSCGNVHRSELLTDVEAGYSSEQQDSSGCDGECAVCAFFDQISFDLAAEQAIEIVCNVSGSDRFEPIALQLQFERCFDQRGPPVSA